MVAKKPPMPDQEWEDVVEDALRRRYRWVMDRGYELTMTIPDTPRERYEIDATLLQLNSEEVFLHDVLRGLENHGSEETTDG